MYISTLESIYFDDMKCLLAFLLTACIWASYGQTAEVVKFGELQRVMTAKNDTTYVINFWATWCVPCVKEFPAFQALAAKHKNEKVRVVMVSLDFASERDKTLAPFLSKHPIDGKVMLLDEPDYNSWIDRVEKSWGGEIPVTLIVNGAKGIRTFFDHDFTPASLEETFTKTINKHQ
ncbi:MAG: TlpA family protein disulfide reductase [Bacteroidetes bacterium]|nr:TlpA family protein disulfide reductase [Bacteroidota bacterium]